MLGDVVRLLPIALLGAALFAAPAHAATVQVELEDSLDVTPHGTNAAGVPLYSAFFATAVVIHGTVADDNGATPPAGTIVHLSTITHANETPQPLADVTTLADGSFSRAFVPGHSFSIIAEVARPSDPVVPALSAAEGSLIIGIGPNVALTTKLVQRGQPYRIKGFIDIPQPRTAGRILLKRRGPGAKTYRTIAAKRTNAKGQFSFAVVHRKSGTYRYQIVFKPTDSAVWVRSVFKLTVKFSRR